jgi:hypothetical protein
VVRADATRDQTCGEIQLMLVSATVINSVVLVLIGLLLIIFSFVVFRQTFIRQALSNLWAYFVSYLYVVWWGIQLPVRRFLIALPLVLASLWFLLEVVASFWDIVLPALPWWTFSMIFILAVGALLDHWHHFKRSRQESVLTSTLRPLFREIAALDFATGSEGERREALFVFVEKVFVTFSTALHSYGGGGLGINLMLPNDEEALEIVVAYRDLLPAQLVQNQPALQAYDREFRLKKGQGGAGTAWQEECLVYIPSTRHQHGIKRFTDEETLYQLADFVYKPGTPQFKSILCAPVPTRRGVYGVVNFDSLKRDAFGEADFSIAELAASVVGMAIDRYRR